MIWIDLLYFVLGQGSNMVQKHVVGMVVAPTILTQDCTVETAKWSMGTL